MIQKQVVPSSCGVEKYRWFHVKVLILGSSKYAQIYWKILAWVSRKNSFYQDLTKAYKVSRFIINCWPKMISLRFPNWEIKSRKSRSFMSRQFVSSLLSKTNQLQRYSPTDSKRLTLECTYIYMASSFIQSERQARTHQHTTSCARPNKTVNEHCWYRFRFLPQLMQVNWGEFLLNFLKSGWIKQENPYGHFLF